MMNQISADVKSALKTALAMAIAYGIALYMGWDQPKWAGFAVAMISLNNVGQSLNKGAMRMLGTLVGLVMAFVLIGAFPQQRWMFMIFLSIYFGFCTYLMGGRKFQYFYNVSGFVCVIICFSGGVNSVNAFDVGMARTEETALGIFVYSLINILIWPQKSSGELNESLAGLVALHRQMFRSYFSSMTGQGAKDSSQDLHSKEGQTMGKFSGALLSAKADTYEVWEVREHWDAVEILLTKLRASFELWRESCPDVKSLDLKKMLPNIDSFYQGLDERFSLIVDVLEGKSVEVIPPRLSLELNESQVLELAHFERAAVLLARQHLNEIEDSSFSLLGLIQDIKSPRDTLPAFESKASQANSFTLDTDRLVASARVMITMWVAYLIWIHIRIPGGGSFVVMASSLAISASNLPFLPMSKLVKPIILGSAIAGFVYIFIMPSLSSYLGLSLVIFVSFFCICYLLRKPKEALGKALCMVLFLTITSVHNQQTYSFLAAANTSLMFILIVTVLSFTAHIPTTAYPEKAFLNLLQRFFRNADFLLSKSSGDWDKQNWVSRGLRTLFHSESLLGIVQKMQIWNRMIDYTLFPDVKAEEIKDLLSGLQELAFRIQQLSDAGKLPQAESLVGELKEDIRLWRSAIQQLFETWEANPAVGYDEDLRVRLADKLSTMETRITETLAKAKPGELKLQDYENLYSLLGCFRGLSQSIVEHVNFAGKVNWQQLQDSRF